jgi:hypothetical protein
MTVAETHWITPSLLLGRVPAGMPSATRVSSPTQALAAISAGKIAVLPAGDWDGAKNVLQWLGLPPEMIHDRLTFASTGYIPGR